jgi:hypothetical protein
LFAVFFRRQPAFSANDNHRYLLRVAEGGEGLQEFVAYVLGHTKFEENCIGLMFKGKRKALLSFSGVDDLTGVDQFEAYQAPNGVVVIYN